MGRTIALLLCVQLTNASVTFASGKVRYRMPRSPRSSETSEPSGRATQVGQEISAALAGQQSVAEALEKAQALTADEMEAAGY